MVSHPEKESPPIAVAMAWATRLTTFGLEMSLPPLAGWWADGRLGTEPVLLIVGGVLGLITGMMHLFRELLPKNRPASADSSDSRNRDGRDEI